MNDSILKHIFKKEKTTEKTLTRVDVPLYTDEVEIPNYLLYDQLPRDCYKILGYSMNNVYRDRKIQMLIPEIHNISVIGRISDSTTSVQYIAYKNMPVMHSQSPVLNDFINLVTLYKNLVIKCIITQVPKKSITPAEKLPQRVRIMMRHYFDKKYKPKISDCVDNIYFTKYSNIKECI